jgi:hypothetical protein
VANGVVQHWYVKGAATGLTRESLVAADIRELIRLIYVVEAAGAIPSRLGKDATGDELSMDKRYARRIAHCFRQSLKAWGGVLDDAGEHADHYRRVAATVKWADLISDRQAYLMERLPLYATLAIDEGDRSWGNQALARINNELGWLTYSLRTV